MMPVQSRKGVLQALLLLLRHASQAAGERYELEESYVGNEFLDKWDFFTDPDPTHGHVEYVDSATAVREGLARSMPDMAYVGVDMTTPATNASLKRRSVRLHSKATYNGGLFIIDVEHMPRGCGSWPAFWMFGADEQHVWPSWGEYDFIEALHNGDKMTTTLHTGAGCSQSQVKPGKHFSQRWKNGATGQPANNCDVNAEGQYLNQGCSQDGAPASAGPIFNAAGGGTFVGEWDPVVGHIRQWFWPRGSEPADVAARTPEPDLWGQPAAYFSLARETCSPEHLRNMKMVLNIALCGDLGKAFYSLNCPAEASRKSCEELVSDPQSLSEAFWSIRKLDVYTQKSDKNYVVFADHPENYPLRSQEESPLGVNFLRSRSTTLGVVLLLVGTAGLCLVMRSEVVKWYYKVGGTDVEAGRLGRSEAEEPFWRRTSTASPKTESSWAKPMATLPGLSLFPWPQQDTGRSRGRSTSSESSTFLSNWSRPPTVSRTSSTMSAASDWFPNRGS